MGISAKEAAESIGITKHAIIKSIREGRISAIKNAKGQWEIEPSELYRVYTPINSVNSEPNTQSQLQYTPEVHTGTLSEIIELRVKRDAAQDKIHMLEEQLRKAELREQDLSAKLDKAQSTIERQTYLISDMREKTIEKPVERPKRFFGMFSRSNS
jgi:hypothetical protein